MIYAACSTPVETPEGWVTVCAEPAVRWVDGTTPVCAEHDDDLDDLDNAP